MDIQGNDIDQRLIDYSSEYRDYREVEEFMKKYFSRIYRDTESNESTDREE